MNLFVLFSHFTMINAALFSEKIQLEWNNFKLTYGKTYSNKLEENIRMIAFAENFKKIEKHNWMFVEGNTTYKMAINKFSDMTEEEFIKYYTCLKEKNGDLNREEFTFIASNYIKIPDEIDWRKMGYVTPVKDQGDCGSCWAFSATGSLEGQHYNRTKKLVSLSEQNLVDCSQPYGNEGCNGGWPTQAFDYILHNGGIDTEESYPYEGKDRDCRFNKKTIGATLKHYVKVQENEASLTAAIASVGPISVAIFANDNFQHYHSGIFNDPTCKGPLNHAVLAVGYGVLSNHDYYLVKNSWGTDWGNQGYIYMSRNARNQCGIASKASFPLV